LVQNEYQLPIKTFGFYNAEGKKLWEKRNFLFDYPLLSSDGKYCIVIKTSIDEESSSSSKSLIIYDVIGEEIFKDRKILKREKFLNLSRSSYLFSKIIILTVISSIQAFLYVLVGNLILGVPGLFFEYWFALFSIFILANMIGLNVSQTFNSAVTIYILIPFILIPMMALGGAMFSFDKLNRTIGSVGKVPVIAELMPSKWIYEALMVHQFKNNQLGKTFYPIEKLESQADFAKVHYIPVLGEKLDEAITYQDSVSEIGKERFEDAVELLFNEITLQQRRASVVHFEYLSELGEGEFNDEMRIKTQKGLVIGGNGFISGLEKQLGRILRELRPGRPRKTKK